MPQGADDASLQHQLEILRRRWFVVVLLAVLSGAIAAALTLGKQPVYQAVASVRVPAFADDEPEAVPRQDPRFVATEVEVLRSTRDDLVGQLGADVAVNLKRRDLTELVDVRATSATHQGAVEAATTFAETYVGRRNDQRVLVLGEVQKAVQAQITGLDTKIAELDEQLVGLEGRTAEGARPRPPVSPDRAVEITTKLTERQAVADQRASLTNQLDLVQQRLSAPATSGGAQVVTRAERADRVSPSTLRNGALGLGGGLVLGVGLALFLDKVDDRLRRREDLEAAVDLPVVGILPRVSRRQIEEGPVGVLAPGSPSDEAYRTLRTNLSLLTGGRAIRCLQVTSPTANEGKTTVATTLAVSFAQAGQRVIVVDCDLRQPRVHEAFGLANDGGLSSVLLGQGALADAITTLVDQPCLVVLPAGPTPPNPSDLLATERAGAVLATLRAHCDVLLIDAPSVLTAPDARILSRHVDAVLLVARPMRSTRREVARAHQLLAQVGAPIAGTVLSAVLHDAGRAPARPATGARAERAKQQKPPARPSERGAVELPGT